MKSKLDKAREEINAVDKEIAELFVKRMRASEAVAQYKREHGLEILDRDREAFLIDRNSQWVDDPVLREYYVRLQKSVMEISRSYQARLNEGMRVAFSGSHGAFAEQAALSAFPYCVTVGYPSFDSAYESVVSGECDAAVLPIENSYYGEVGQVTDLMFSGSLYVNNVKELAITHDLLAIEGASLGDIKYVVSHPQALGQCHRYLREHNFTEIEYSNTALAAKYVSEKGDRAYAALASEDAAKEYGLTVLERGVNAQRSNTTRFAVFTRAERKHREADKGVHTILLFTVRNEAGALAKAIDIIGKHGFNMRSLRSRPMKELLWQYYFYVEAEGNVSTDEGQAMLCELSEYCDRLKAVGSYVKFREDEI